MSMKRGVRLISACGSPGERASVLRTVDRKAVPFVLRDAFPAWRLSPATRARSFCPALEKLVEPHALSTIPTFKLLRPRLPGSLRMTVAAVKH
jgi:hypothetical protein